MEKKYKMFIIYVLLSVLALSAILTMIFLPPSKGNLPQFTDESGAVLKDSISEKSFIEIDGGRIGLYILSKNHNNPVLLFCGGGPGIPQYLLENLYPSVLSDFFTVCYFDYRGVCRSFDRNTVPGKMTEDLFLSDVDKLTDYLRSRFGQEKIYIMGHSFGTFLALSASYNHPEKYKAYFAMSQVVDSYQSECIAFDYMKEQYIQKNDKKMLSSFEKFNIKNSKEDYSLYKTSSLRDKAMHDLGVGTTRKMKSVIKDIFFKSLRCRAYTPRERINLWRGKISANKYEVTNQAFNFNAFEHIQSLEIPVYFFAGEYDYTVCEILQRKYFDFLQAPEKRYFLYEDCAHSPIYEDSAKTKQILAEICR